MGTASGTTLTTLMTSTSYDAHNPFEPGLHFMVGLVVGYARELADQRSNLVRRPQPPGLDDFLGQALAPQTGSISLRPGGFGALRKPTYCGLTATPGAAALICQSAFTWKG